MKVTSKNLKAIAKSIRIQLKHNGQRPLSHSLWLMTISNALGFKNWETLEAKLDSVQDDSADAQTQSSVGPFHFGEIMADVDYALFNGKTLYPIQGTWDIVPGVAKLNSVTVGPDGTVTREYEGETEILWDDQKTQVDRQGNAMYVDEKFNLVSEPSVVYAPVNFGSEPQNFPIRRALVNLYWERLAQKTDIVAFLGLPEDARKPLIAKAYDEIQFELTAKEYRCLLDNQVFDERFLDEWFTVQCKPGEPDGDFMSGRMFETYGEELDYVLSIANSEPGRVWTWLDCDGEMVVGSGYHLVNRVGYFITEKALPDNVTSVEFMDEEAPDEFDDDSEFDEDSSED